MKGHNTMDDTQSGAAVDEMSRQQWVRDLNLPVDTSYAVVQEILTEANSTTSAHPEIPYDEWLKQVAQRVMQAK
jgi:hypothetical protein